MDRGSKKFKLILIVLLIVGVALLTLAPVIALVGDRTLLYQNFEEEIKDDSMGSLKDAFTQEVTLRKDERLIIEFNDNHYSIIC